jgi:hypothetical protein
MDLLASQMGAVFASDFAAILASARVFVTQSVGDAFQILVALLTKDMDPRRGTATSRGQISA